MVPTQIFLMPNTKSNLKVETLLISTLDSFSLLGSEVPTDRKQIHISLANVIGVGPSLEAVVPSLHFALATLHST